MVDIPESRVGDKFAIAKLKPKLNKYQIVARGIASQISEGSLGIGSRLETENELAVRYGVSRVTARQALSLLHQEGIVRRRQGKGTFVSKLPDEANGGNSSKNSATHRQIRQVGLVIAQPDFNDYYTLNEIGFVERQLANRGIGFSLVVLKPKDIVTGHLPPAMKNNLCDGYLFDLIECGSCMPALSQPNIPMIAIGNHRIGPGLSCVRFPVEKAVHKACEMFLEKSQRPVAFIGGPIDFDTAGESLIAYLMAMKRAGHRPVQELFCGPATCCKSNNSMWHDATEEVESIVRRINGPFSLITTVATIQSVLAAYRKFGLSPAEYPVLSIGVCGELSAEECAQIYIVPIAPEPIVEIAIEKLLELREKPGAVIHAEITYEILKPGEFDYKWLSERKARNIRAYGAAWK